jgi:uncharacterized protein
MGEEMAMRFRQLVWVAALLTLPASVDASGDLRLVDAVRTRDTKAVAGLIKERVDTRATAPDGSTALHWAAHWNDIDSAALLIRSGADVNAVNDYGMTPLIVACVDADDMMVGMLLKRGANPNLALPSGETPLMTAARTGKTEAMRLLLEQGAKIDAAERERGQTALMWAIAEGHRDAVRMLIANGANVRARSLGGFSALLFAARDGDLEMVRLLVEAGGDVNEADERGASALLVATVRGHVDLAKWLLEKGADPNADGSGYTALHWAAGTWESVITYDYPNAPGEWQALAGIPTREAKRGLIKALLERGADVNARVTKPPLRHGYSLYRGSYAVGATPFHLAAQVADVEIMRLLLANGADPTASTKDGTTALHAAAGIGRSEHESRVPESSYIEALKMVLELGGDTQAVNAAGWNALHTATYSGFDAMVQLLVDRGVPLDERTKAGNTALGIAEGDESAGTTGRFQSRPSTAALLRRLGAAR